MDAECHDVFVYGGLLKQDVCFALLERFPRAYASRLDNFRLACIKSSLFVPVPVAVRQAAAWIDGMVFEGISDFELELIQAFYSVWDGPDEGDARRVLEHTPVSRAVRGGGLQNISGLIPHRICNDTDDEDRNGAGDDVSTKQSNNVACVIYEGSARSEHLRDTWNIRNFMKQSVSHNIFLKSVRDCRRRVITVARSRQRGPFCIYEREDSSSGSGRANSPPPSSSVTGDLVTQPVRVTGYFELPKVSSRAGAERDFIVFMVQSEYGLVLRRYSQFRALFRSLVSFAVDTPALPERHSLSDIFRRAVSSGNDDLFLDRRRAALEVWLNAVAQHEMLSASHPLFCFLCDHRIGDPTKGIIRSRSWTDPAVVYNDVVPSDDGDISGGGGATSLDVREMAVLLVTGLSLEEEGFIAGAGPHSVSGCTLSLSTKAISLTTGTAGDTKGPRRPFPLPASRVLGAASMEQTLYLYAWVERPLQGSSRRNDNRLTHKEFEIFRFEISCHNAAQASALREHALLLGRGVLPPTFGECPFDVLRASLALSRRRILVIIDPTDGQKAALQRYQQSVEPFLKLAGVDVEVSFVADQADALKQLQDEPSIRAIDLTLLFGSDNLLHNYLAGSCVQRQTSSTTNIPIAIIPDRSAAGGRYQAVSHALGSFDVTHGLYTVLRGGGIGNRPVRFPTIECAGASAACIASFFAWAEGNIGELDMCHVSKSMDRLVDSVVGQKTVSGVVHILREDDGEILGTTKSASEAIEETLFGEEKNFDTEYWDRLDGNFSLFLVLTAPIRDRHQYDYDTARTSNGNEDGFDVFYICNKHPPSRSEVAKLVLGIECWLGGEGDADNDFFNDSILRHVRTRALHIAPSEQPRQIFVVDGYARRASPTVIGRMYHGAVLRESDRSSENVTGQEHNPANNVVGPGAVWGEQRRHTTNGGLFSPSRKSTHGIAAKVNGREGNEDDSFL